MANVPLSSQAITTDPTNGQIYIMTPNAGSSTGFSSFRITVTDLQGGLQSQITANSVDIATNTADIAALDNAVRLEKISAFSGDVSATFEVGDVIEKITVKQNSQTTITVRIGITSGGQELLSDSQPSAEDIFGTTRVVGIEEDIYPTSGNRTIHIRATGGTAEATIRYRRSLFNTTQRM